MDQYNNPYFDLIGQNQDERYFDLFPEGTPPDTFAVIRAPCWPVTSEIVREAVAQNIQPDDQVVEAGCGYGLLKKIAGARYRNWHQCENDPIPAMRAARLNPDTDSRLLDVRHLSRAFGRNFADCVVSYNFLDILSKPNLDASIIEMRRVLREGGMLLHIEDLLPNYPLILRNVPRQQIAFPGHNESAEAVGFQLVKQSELPEARLDDPRLDLACRSTLINAWLKLANLLHQPKKNKWLPY